MAGAIGKADAEDGAGSPCKTLRAADAAGVRYPTLGRGRLSPEDLNASGSLQRGGRFAAHTPDHGTKTVGALGA
jgi:hypothetical protein